GVWVGVGVDRTAPYQTFFDTTEVPNGFYDLRAVARDAAGNTAPSAAVEGINVDNAQQPAPPKASVQAMAVPARALTMLGAVTGPQQEAGAVGFRSGAPARVEGELLPYTAQGAQPVLLRYTDATGWNIADVLRRPGGEPFALLPPDDVDNAGVLVRGGMLPTGEAWLWVAERSTDPSVRPVYGLFHRLPGGQFILDPAATAAMGESLRAPTGGLGNGPTLRLKVANGAAFGLLVSPRQAARPVDVPAPGGGSVSVQTRLDFGALAGGTWTRHTVGLPAGYMPAAGDRPSPQAAPRAPPSPRL